jgi:hypothetical protein
MVAPYKQTVKPVCFGLEGYSPTILSCQRQFDDIFVGEYPNGVTPGGRPSAAVTG